ncbi:Rpn family recombination-promoting nuclease/putative transposase [Pseudanabaena sp. PCC 6802]|uniref:Rpn family recombination-promoting nuclease/putative transposase n=1 Tax=Pseudanabaena sp. PCC 6802 TaxID=118173 RepID=UPI0003477341|nr:Rpn family recombination-promoting nuclease/putative transposase [Pseudanabaena sp. PCC 6802]
MANVFINPKTDFAFKKIFGSEQSKDILISFLDAILYDAQNMIRDLVILDPYQAPQIEGIKESFLDVKATLTNGKTVIIEMQVLNVLGFDKRILYNAAKAFSIQLDVGEDYTLLNPVIALTITDFEMFSDSDRVISRYRLKEKDDLTDYSDDIELVFVELPKFQKDLDRLETLVDKWIYFLKSANKLESVPPNMGEVPAIGHAFVVAEQSRLSRQELEILEKRQRVLHDSRNMILLAQQTGYKEGRQEGRLEGRQEERLEIASSLLDILDAETIAQKTGLTVAEVERLKE